LADKYRQIDTKDHGRIWAYEVDGYGNTLRMDDANAPGLASLAYLRCVAPDQRAVYERSRAFALSTDNPYLFRGTAAEVSGGPHIGLGYIWPMGIMFRAFSSTNKKEIVQCLRWLRDTTAGTYFMHEPFWQDDPAKYHASGSPGPRLSSVNSSSTWPYEAPHFFVPALLALL